jgi:starvation-inducible outer membrane lipoprotein
MTDHVVAGLVISFGLALAGCQSMPQAVQQKEDPLAASGFTPQPTGQPT